SQISGKIDFAGEKVSSEDSLFSSLQGISLSGYEIHMGESRILKSEKNAHPLACLKDKISGEEKTDGCICNNVLGSYVHGFFDEKEVCLRYFEILGKKKGLSLKDLRERQSQLLNGNQQFAGNLQDFKESQYNLLADTLRKHLDMKKIYEIMGVKNESL
ncbi:MAG: hypothetical protein K5873_11385, partial [Treponema sp.]|nr:hypothetical protein [Treponema sp.]